MNQGGSNFPPNGGNVIKKPSPKQKKAAQNAPAGKAKSGGKDIVVFGLNATALIAKLKSKKRAGKPDPVEEDPDEPVEVFVEMMESDEPPPPTGPRSRVRYDDDAPVPSAHAGKRSRPAAKDAFPEDDELDGELDGEEEDAPKKRGPFGLFSLFGGKKKSKQSKGKSAKKAKSAPPRKRSARDYDKDEEDEDEELDEIEEFDENEEEEEEDSPRSRKGKKDKGGKKSSKSARGGRKKKKGSSPVLMVLLVLALVAALAYMAHMYGLIDLSMYIDNITQSLTMLLSMAGL